MTDKLAGRRLLTINLVRLGGALMVPAGFLVLRGRIAALAGEWQQVAGVVLVLAGVAAFAAGPILLSRRWASAPRSLRDRRR